MVDGFILVEDLVWLTPKLEFIGYMFDVFDYQRLLSNSGIL